MTNEELYEKAKEAISELFNDNSVSQDDCRGNLEGLKEEIEVLLEAISEDGGE